MLPNITSLRALKNPEWRETGERIQLLVGRDNGDSTLVYWWSRNGSIYVQETGKREYLFPFMP
jgi:hypothetical protein